MIKQYFRLGLVLAAFAVAACVGLSFVYAATKDRIAANQGRRLTESLRAFFPEAESFKDIGASLPACAGQTKMESAFAAERGGAILGVAVEATGPSYGGPVTVLIGLGTDRRIAGVRVLASSDTPGLGLNALNPGYYVDRVKKLTFPGQFFGKPLTDDFVVRQDVDAITASTITSRAITTIVKAAADAGESWIERNAQGGK
jgi:electron transport complex protein RnfG